MKNIFRRAFFVLFLLSSCSISTPTAIPLVSAPTTIQTSPPSPTQAPSIPTFTPAPQSAFDDHPVFLAWPLPASIGLARISQYPNTPWTWNYLGLNEGYQCPPMFGYLEGSYEYWRDPTILYEQDRAQADPHNFEMIECYTTGNVGASGHEGTDIKAPAGIPVYAAADGKVLEWRLTGLNSMIVLKHCLGGSWDAQDQCNGKQWYTTYMHIIVNPDLLAENFDVLQGNQVGTIYDQTINSHLHFEVGLDKRGYENYVNPWGRDESPWLGCTWLEQSLCPLPDPNANRIALLEDSSLSIRQGEADILIKDMPDIKKIRLHKDRVALMDSQGRLFLRDGKFNAGENSMQTWILLAEKISDFEISDQRVAILDLDGNLLVNETNLPSGWMLQAGNIRAVSISSHRVGYLTNNGELYVKEGDLANEWIPLVNNVAAFQLTDNRMAILDLQGNLFVNEGEVGAEWKQMAERVRAFQITNLRVGILDAGNNLLVKEGNLRAEFVRVAENVRAFQLSNYRMLIQSADGIYKYQEGNIYQSLKDMSPDLQGAFLNDAAPVYVQ